MGNIDYFIAASAKIQLRLKFFLFIDKRLSALPRRSNQPKLEKDG